MTQKRVIRCDYQNNNIIFGREGLTNRLVDLKIKTDIPEQNKNFVQVERFKLEKLRRSAGYHKELSYIP